MSNHTLFINLQSIKKTGYSKSSIFMASGICLILLVLLFAVSPIPFGIQCAEAARARLENIEVKASGGELLVNATLKGAFSSDIQEAITSGAPTRFKFFVSLKKDRNLWFDKKIQVFEIYHTVTYDVLKKEYTIIRSYPDNKEEELTTTDFEEMTQLMGALKSVLLNFPALKDHKGHYFVKLKAEMKCIKIPFPLNYLFSFISLWNFDTPWVRLSLPPDHSSSP